MPSYPHPPRCSPPLPVQFNLVLQRESMREDLDGKMALIFQTYGRELETIQDLYEKHKHAPPIPRNLPPVAGNITWSRNLLRRIEQPMRVFKAHPAVLQSKDARRITKTYNKVGRRRQQWRPRSHV